MLYQLRIGVTSTEPKLRFLLKNPAYVFISNYFFLKKSPSMSTNLSLDL